MARCSARTKSGRRCRAEAGSRSRCRFHQRGGARPPSTSISSRGRSAPLGTIRPLSSNKVRGPGGAKSGPDHARVGHAVMDIVDRQKARMVTSQILSPKVGRALAHGYIHADQRFLKHVAKVATREAAERAIYVGARVLMKGIPVVGWVSLGYDAYTVGKIVREEYLTK